MKRPIFSMILGFVLVASCDKQFETPPHPGRMIKEFTLESGQHGAATIYREGDVFKILVRVDSETDLTNITPIITISDQATISPESGKPIDVSATKRITYTVTSASGLSRRWEVEFRVYESGITDYGTYSVATSTGLVLQTAGKMDFNEKYWANATMTVAAAEATMADNLQRWQEWDVIYHTTENDIRYYQLRNLNSGMFLQAADAGSPVTQHPELKTNADLQLWQIEESTETGQYEISNKANGLYLTLSGLGVANLTVVNAEKQGSERQRWTLTKLPKDSYRDGDVTQFFARTTGSVAFDQGTSIPLSDGRVLWVTQDAWYEGNLTPNGRLYGDRFISYTNSIIIQSSIDNWDPRSPMMTRQGAHHNIGNICPIPAGAGRNWVGPGVELDDYVYIHGSEGNGLDDTDQAIYKLKRESGNEWNQVERLVIPGMTGQLDISYEDGMVKSDDGYVYVYGERAKPGTFGYNTLLYVARFPHENPTGWTYWDGTAWTSAPSVASAAVIHEGNGTNNVAYLNGKYLHLTMDQGFYCGIPSLNMYISTSTSPTGPFTEPKLVYSFSEYYKGYNARVYTPIIHAASQNSKNELLLTYSINFGACAENNENNVKEDDGNLDPYYYRVKGVRVPYEMIGL
ncbi:RICIN domain-containing protein [Parapedobacter deserti]|uniref:RICIN domain-containing protein n=1 Tax=Parapedobacter deserti TaxID=1912957 RepID=A0ABV7JMJ1_9SPHI